MFQQLLSIAFVPGVWKKAVITPVHKKGSTDLLSNYRPISVIMCFSSILVAVWPFVAY